MLLGVLPAVIVLGGLTLLLIALVGVAPAIATWLTPAAVAGATLLTRTLLDEPS
jgi:hypothetical protein